MVWLNRQDLQRLQKIVGHDSDLAERWMGLEKKRVHSDVVTIANTGLVNSGKSSLFNTLSGKWEQERFPVGPVRTTKRSDRESFNKYIDFIDTPGRVAQGTDDVQEDDKTAFRALLQSDFIVITHNIKTGMLNRSECEWIEKIAQSLGKNVLSNRLFFVCTWTDERDREQDYRSLLSEIKRQLNQVLQGVEIPFWEVSAKRYILGKKNSKAALEKNSNIPQFKQALVDAAMQYLRMRHRQGEAEVLELCEATEKQLNSEKQVIIQKIQRKRNKIHEITKSNLEQWNLVLNYFKEKRSILKQYKQNLAEQDSLFGLMSILLQK